MTRSVPKSDTLGLFLVELLKKAKDLYPGDLEAQSRYVRRQMIDKRNEQTRIAIDREIDAGR